MTEALRPFSEWLTDHAQGQADDEMTAAVAEVVQQVAHLGKKGKVTMTVNIEPVGSGGRTVATECKVVAAPPLPDPEGSIFYIGEGGSLHREDPYQERLDLRQAPDDEVAPRALDPETGELRSLEGD